MPRRRTFPYPHIPTEHNGQWFAPLPERPNFEPRTQMQALMEAGIGAEPAESLAERQPLREAIQRCVDSLGEPGKTMIETYFYEGGGYRRVAKRTGMSRMSAHRRMPAVVKRLTQLLLDDPLIRSRVRYSQEEE